MLSNVVFITNLVILIKKYIACLVFTDLFTLNRCSLMLFYSFYRWHLGDVIILSRGFNDLNTNKAHYI